MAASTAPDSIIRNDADGITTITLNRPEFANSFDLEAARSLGAIARSIGPDTRVVALVGAGTRFCAGGDVASFATSTDRPAYLLEIATALGLAVFELDRLSVPVVAGVQGAVAGAGLAVMLAADVIIAARSTKFTMAYAGIGLTPDCGVSTLLPGAVGTQRALELAVTGRVLSANEALEWGLVTEVVDNDSVPARVAEITGRIAGGPTQALGQARRLIRAGLHRTLEQTVLDEARTIAAAVETAEARHLVQRFLDRRDP